MSSLLHFICITLIINCCFGWLRDCDQQLWVWLGAIGSPDDGPREHCAVEGGYCSGAGQVIYGDANQWAVKDVTNGIWCNNDAFGCDPVPLIKKNCYSKYLCSSLQCNSDINIVIKQM